VGGLDLLGPTLTLRYPDLDDAPALFGLGRDPAVSRYFSWGPYERVEEAEAYIAGLPARRAAGELLDFLVVHRQEGPIGITGLSGLSVRDRRAAWELVRAASGARAPTTVKGADGAPGSVPGHGAADRLRRRQRTCPSHRALEQLGFRRRGAGGLAPPRRPGLRVVSTAWSAPRGAPACRRPAEVGRPARRVRGG
jgi:ribosomal-protein-alanine N-acetyltransferase